MIYSAENGQPNESIKMFEKKFKGSIKNFKEILIEAEGILNPENKITDISKINLLKIMGQCDINRENKII
jgi:hypothetical protein